MAEQYSIAFMYHIFVIHSSVNGHLGCVHVLAIVNSAAQWGECILSDCFSLGLCPGVGLLLVLFLAF